MGQLLWPAVCCLGLSLLYNLMSKYFPARDLQSRVELLETRHYQLAQEMSANAGDCRKALQMVDALEDRQTKLENFASTIGKAKPAVRLP